MTITAPRLRREPLSVADVAVTRAMSLVGSGRAGFLRLLPTACALPHFVGMSDENRSDYLREAFWQFKGVIDGAGM